MRIHLKHYSAPGIRAQEGEECFICGQVEEDGPDADQEGE